MLNEWFEFTDSLFLEEEDAILVLTNVILKKDIKPHVKGSQFCSILYNPFTGEITFQDFNKETYEVIDVGVINMKLYPV